MSLVLFNTLTRKKEVFVPLAKGKVGLYSCGPTVYNYAHIGNLRTYIFNDVLRRTLKKNGFLLTHVMNITDVGHLTSDADSGEDKMLAGAKREKKSVWDIAQFYTDAFFMDTERLGIERPEIVCKATDHIKDMIAINQLIEKNGAAYFTGGNLYFDTSHCKDYGKLAKLRKEDLKEGARVDPDKNKKHHTDFVLWFTKSKFDDQEMKWESPWGTGYPGWHIECSAMSSKYLGEQFDIHTGGIDHIPVHHTNEIAQSETAFGKKPWVKYWIHGEFLVFDKQKMAKSGKSFLTLQSLIDKGYDPLVYKYFCYTAHYRSKLNFSYEALDSAKNSFESMKAKVMQIKKDTQTSASGRKKAKGWVEEFMTALNDDLNMPIAMSLVWNVIKESEMKGGDKMTALLEMDEVLGFGISEWKEESIDVPKEVLDLAEQREAMRKEKKWKEADILRDKIASLGYIIEDGEGGKIKPL